MELQTGNFSKIYANLTEDDFKKEWSHIERAGVKAILKDFLYEELDIHDTPDHYFGLAWTSSGRFAELGVTNPEYTIEGNELNAFIIRNNNQLVAHCFDENENDVFYEMI